MRRSYFSVSFVLVGLAFAGCKNREFNTPTVENNDDNGDVLATGAGDDAVCAKAGVDLQDNYVITGRKQVASDAERAGEAAKFQAQLMAIDPKGFEVLAKSVGMNVPGGNTDAVTGGKYCIPISPFRALSTVVNSSTTPQQYAALISSLKATTFRQLPAGVKPINLPIIANVGHNNQFWLAQLNLEDIKSVHFMVEQFKVQIPPGGAGDFYQKYALNYLETQTKNGISRVSEPAIKSDMVRNAADVKDKRVVNSAHGQIRVVFNSPIQLIGQNKLNFGKTITTKSVIFSVHALSHDGGYNPLLGSAGAYALGLGAYTAEQKFNESLVSKNTYRQYKMKISNDEVAAYVQKYSAHALTFFRTRDYDTMKSNCGSVQFEVLEDAYFRSKVSAAMGQGPTYLTELRSQEAVNMGRGNPQYAQYTLKAYGLLDTPDMNGVPWTSLEKY